MSNIKAAFEKKKQEGKKAFIPFITAGDPDLESTERFVYALERAGSTLIEIGIPFSDPVADGPVIQRANLRAMAGGVHIKKVFDMVGNIRKTTQIPLVFLMYANTIYHYGIEAFFKKCKEVGVDGVIIPDLPHEEKEEFDEFARLYDVDIIGLIAPTSKERTKMLCENTRGFLYCVSSLGVTGMRSKIETDFGEMFEEIKKYSKVPTALGFGISTKEQAEVLKDYADGIIIGSAVVKIIEEKGKDATADIEAFAKEIVEVM
nr:tryptophan synthase subunit alpha [uncultured Cellulosilyticum sp.]